MTSVQNAAEGRGHRGRRRSARCSTTCSRSSTTTAASRRLRGYVARNSIEVRVEPIERAGEVIDLAVQSGATSVSSLRFDVKDREALEREALAKAVSRPVRAPRPPPKGAGRRSIAS